MRGAVCCLRRRRPGHGNQCVANGGLTYTNDVFYGEMCNIWGQTVGVVIDCTLP